MLSLQCLGVVPFLLRVSLFSTSSFQERTISASKIAETMAPEGWPQMANPSPWATLAASAVPLDREYWKHCFSPQTRNKRYCETAETSETKKNLSPPTQCCELCQILPPLKCSVHPEKLNLERVWLFHLVGYFSESLIHWRMYLHLVARALQGTSELCLPVGNVTVLGQE